MRLPSRLLTCCLLSLLIGAGACVIKSADNEANGEGGSAGISGEGGMNSAGGTSNGGSAGAPDDGCGDVPFDGLCADDHTVKSCIVPDEKPAYVMTTPCPSGEVCKSGSSGALCGPPGECVEGDSSCTVDGTGVRACVGTGVAAKWQITQCKTSDGEQCYVGKPGTPAACRFVPSQAGGEQYPFKGRIQYEYRPVIEEPVGFGDLKVAEGSDLYVGIFDGEEQIGKALTGYDPDTQQFTNDGTFKAVLSKAPGPNTTVWVWPLAFDYDTGLPLMAIAKAKSSSIQESTTTADEYWAFGMELGGATEDMGTFVIKESEGSGAINIYAFVDYSLLRAGAAAPGVKQKSMIVYWSPQHTPECGACFSGGGGGVVKFGPNPEDVDSYDYWMIMGGPDDSRTHWSVPVIGHETGHYVMANYSASPHEGGSHSSSNESKPGLAYSEGWATMFGQTNIPSPLYMNEDEGTTWWADVSKYVNAAGPCPKPDPNGPIDQYVSENITGGMLWRLWTDANVQTDGRNLGDGKMFAAFTNEKLTDGTYNRGYPKVDLVDYFDVALCSGQATEEDIKAVVATTGYPYDPATKECH